MSVLSWSDFREKISRQAELRGIPISGIFELTARCNLTCKMCYVRRRAGDKAAMSGERSVEEWVQLAKEARNAGMLYVLLTGGEVFIRGDFREIYEEISMMGLVPTIYTNATLITPEVVTWIKQIPPASIEVTLYGSSPTTYQKVCGSADSYNKTINGIDSLLDAGINLKLKTTVIPDNKRDYEKLVKFAAERKLILHFCFYISRRRTSYWKAYEIPRLKPKQLSDYLYKASDDFRSLQEIEINDQQPDMDGNNINDEKTEKLGPFRCSAGKRDFWITWDGKMTPCGLMSDPHTFPFEDGFQHAWEELRQKMYSIPVCESCETCSLRKYCLTCPARLRNETGYYNQPSEYLCNFAKHQYFLYSNQ